MDPEERMNFGGSDEGSKPLTIPIFQHQAEHDHKTHAGDTTLEVAWSSSSQTVMNFPESPDLALRGAHITE